MAHEKNKAGKFYVTTPIYYINYNPSVGSAYTTIAADILARWHRLMGRKVFFLTGLDENSSKTVQAAKDAGISNIQSYADGMAVKWQEAWRILNISNDGFIRTTAERHKKAVNDFFLKVFEKGDIYKGKYEGFYCEGCEAFVKESDLLKGECPVHKKPPKKIVEENYFFRLSKYQNKLLDYIERNTGFVQPETKRNEIMNFIRGGLEDISVSRPNLVWGIPLPIDKKHHYWVWFDALVNYISGAPKEFWPADVHLIGKDILRFHCAIWPAMLMSAGYELPKAIFAHGFFTVNGQKMSKSLGNAIDPVHISKKYSVDALRYYLMRDIPFGGDGDYSEEALVARINGELVSDLGNLVYRVLTLAERFEGEIKGNRETTVSRASSKARGKPELEAALNLAKIKKHMEKYELHLALDGIMNFVRACNKYINDRKVWTLKGVEMGNALYNLLESLRIIAILTHPFMPSTAEKINEQLGVKAGLLNDCKFGAWKTKPRKGAMLFRKIEQK